MESVYQPEDQYQASQQWEGKEDSHEEEEYPDYTDVPPAGAD